jgi:ATP-dependent protease HslVU (ClpYQ) peptidase subunit
MTTIATDGRTIAADGLVTAGIERIDTSARKIVRVDGLIYALCGRTSALRPLVRWHQDGADPDTVPKVGGEWGLVVIDPNQPHAHYYHNDALFPSFVPYPCAFGTGEQFARGAMLAGADPRRAVEIAAECDVNTGGTITHLDIGPAIGRVPKHRAA